MRDAVSFLLEAIADHGIASGWWLLFFILGCHFTGCPCLASLLTLPPKVSGSGSMP